MAGGRIFGPGDGGRRRRGFTGDFGWDGLLNFFRGVGEGGRREEGGLALGRRKEVGKVLTYLPGGSGVLLVGGGGGGEVAKNAKARWKWKLC